MLKYQIIADGNIVAATAGSDLFPPMSPPPRAALPPAPAAAQLPPPPYASRNQYWLKLYESQPEQFAGIMLHACMQHFTRMSSSAYRVFILLLYSKVNL
jgi:hypothetical protein